MPRLFGTRCDIVAGLFVALWGSVVCAEVQFVGFDASQVVDVGTSITLSWEGNVSVSILSLTIQVPKSLQEERDLVCRETKAFGANRIISMEQP